MTEPECAHEDEQTFLRRVLAENERVDRRYPDKSDDVVCVGGDAL